MSAIAVQRGFDADALFETVYGSSEPYALDVEELDRVEVRVPNPSQARGVAYLRALGELRPLPAGASFDAARGVFAWQPGPGFIGRYHFVIVTADGAGGQTRYELEVTLRPRQR
jgi:hypothetical protein